MTAAGANSSRLRERLQFAIRGGIHYFSFWLLPALVVVFTAAAFLILPSLYTATDSQALHLRSLPIQAGHPSPGSNIAALQTVPLQQSARFDHGIWLSIALPDQAKLQPMAVDFPARGVRNLTCWREDTLEALGSAEGMATQGAIRRSRLGHALMLGHNESGVGSSFSNVICRAEFSAPTTFTADLWSIPDLRSASDRFHRGVALLEGGVVTLALFLSIVAIRHREWTFLLLAIWLIGNLRLGTYALGWDGQWLGFALPADLQTLLRQFTVAAYYIVSLALFSRFLHRTDHYSPGMMALQGLGLIQLGAAFLLPWGAFQVLSTPIWAVTLLMGSWMLASSLTRQGKNFNWRIVPLGFALLVLLSALAMTLMGAEQLLDSMTAVIAILVSNVFVALAVSDILREGQMLRRRAQTALVTSYAVAPLGLFTLDDNGRFIQMNPILRDMLQATSDENAVLHWTDYFPPQDWASIARATLAGKETEVLLPPMRDEKQPTRHFALRAALVGEQVEGSLQDITARTEAMNALRDMVDTDTLTNALNRRGIEKQLGQAIGLLKRNNTPCSLAYMDLDHFKRINGLFGHTSGDEILKQITQRLRAVLSEKQSLGRIGSDEFVILFPDMSAADARHLAEQIITNLNGSSYQVGQRYFQVRSAIGVVQIDASMDAAAAISAASRACRDARKQHQDVVVYEQDSSELQAHTEELRLFDQLEGGASPKGLYLEMQPIMALKNPNDGLNFEILLRVRDSQGRLLPTGKIVSGAEESGTITIIDKWVFSATLEWLAKHEDHLRKTQFVNVNLSGVSLNDDKFIENLFQLLNRHPRLVRRLCVEITEGVALQNLERTRQLIVRLQSMGIRIALDDFGAGYTSFSYLRQLGADAVKIDGAFVRDMLVSDTNVAIVRTIVELAQNLRMMSIAEWVEDPRALDLLREMGVDYVQGHAISTALTPMEILDAESLSDLVANADTLAYIKRNAGSANL